MVRVSSIGLATLGLSLVLGRAQAASQVTGDYVEARSANVYVGACHHEGELLTTGRNAILAWNISDGEYRGVALRGVTAVAVLAAERNLEFSEAKRRSVLYITDAATPDQRNAVVDLLRERAGTALGEVVIVKSVPITFDAAGDEYRVRVSGAAYIRAKKGPGQLCCKQPYQVWGQPLISVKDAKTGYCISAEYKEKGLLQTWGSSDQNNTFFGQFSL